MAIAISFKHCRVGLVALLGLGAAACASDKSLVSHALNNVAARDNGFFLAREKLWATEATLYKGRPNDYNQVLALYPVLDSTTVRATRTDLNDIIKKASLPIQHRSGSDWTDDAYLLVAWSRFYKMEFDDAELTFKYVNSTSKDPFAKQEALIGLMRTFLMLKRPDDARAVSNLLDKEVGLEKDARELFLVRADYYLKTEEPDKAILALERAVPLIPQKNERSRTRYILAQLYQEQGNNKLAAEQLNQILKRNPPYELDFQAKLLLGQVSDLDTQSKARLDKYFAGLLKDPKNKEYQDKIYYEMGRLAYRQQKYSESLALLRKSAKVASTNKSQKGYTYLLAGRIYYENLHKYPLAAAYYDSTTQVFPKDNPKYAAIKERADILKEFAKQYTIIQTQDSLQALAKLPAAELEQRLNTYAAAELEAKRKAAAKAVADQKAKDKQQQLDKSRISSSSAPSGPSALSGNQRDISNVNAFDATSGVASGAAWYFDNPASLASARQDFIVTKKWGDRKLQDNWRTLNTPSNSPNTQQNGAAPLAQTGNDHTRVNGGTDGKPMDGQATDPLAEQNALVVKYKSTLPDTPAKLEASDKQVEAAMYELGGIYKELLKEKDHGYETYAGEVKRYPRGEHAPDADYLLYLYYKDLPDPAKAAEYAAALQRYFPQSIYAKLIADPLYREHERALHNAVAAKLDAAFLLYKDQLFTKAKAAVADIEQQYPKSDLNDRVAYLKMLLAIRTLPAAQARPVVAQFLKDYPDSQLVPQAQALAASFQKADAGQLTGALASTDKPVISMFRPGEVDNRLRILYGEDESPEVALPTPSPTTPATTDAANLMQAAGAAEKKITPLPTGGAGPAPAGAGAGPAPAGAGPAPAPAPTQPKAGPGPAPGAAPAPAGTSPAPTAGKAAAPAAPETAPAVAYTTQLSAAHAVVLVYPKGAEPTPDLATKLMAYDGKYFQASNLTVQPAQPLGTDQEMVVVRALTGSKVAQGYASKLRGPQSPLARLRGQGYQAIVISLANLTLLQAAGGDLAGYLQFYSKVYQ